MIFKAYTEWTLSAEQVSLGKDVKDVVLLSAFQHKIMRKGHG